MEVIHTRKSGLDLARFDFDIFDVMAVSVLATENAAQKESKGMTILIHT